MTCPNSTHWSTVLDENHIEMAEKLEQEQRRQAIAAAALRAAPETHPKFNGKDCLNYDGKIPKGQLALDRIRCVHCQELIERRRRT